MLEVVPKIVGKMSIMAYAPGQIALREDPLGRVNKSTKVIIQDVLGPDKYAVIRYRNPLAAPLLATADELTFAGGDNTYTAAVIYLLNDPLLDDTLAAWQDGDQEVSAAALPPTCMRLLTLRPRLRTRMTLATGTLAVLALLFAYCVYFYSRLNVVSVTFSHVSRLLLALAFLILAAVLITALTKDHDRLMRVNAVGHTLYSRLAASDPHDYVGNPFRAVFSPLDGDEIKALIKKLRLDPDALTDAATAEERRTADRSFWSLLADRLLVLLVSAGGVFVAVTTLWTVDLRQLLLILAAAAVIDILPTVATGFWLVRFAWAARHLSSPKTF
ncbi:hypothetical protein L248_1882 [Schleiferilactobacillus shenzhenensis LY-73]|uniref:Uncharacterized protein n=2 Tax=Schleiferilactobacillus shenzhenensis TaxID=1231337 RepID=U4TLR5_9LACO|nr:hypothetical protein L248_1882 [Schleiferilactobacillus shenzhenensis LY-73]